MDTIQETEFARLRRKAGLSIDDAASELKLSFELIQSFENGLCKPEPRNLQILKGLAVVGRNAKATSSARSCTMVDLFAGCGGLSLGFENAGFTPIFVNELDKDAIGTYLANRHHELGGLRFADNPNLHCRDVNDLDNKRLEQLIADFSALNEVDFKFDKGSRDTSGAGSTLDIITGGPPCQGFSGIGIRRSYSVDKKELPSNRLYVKMARIIRRLRPRIFLFENVRGLLNSKWERNGTDRIWPDVKAEFESIPGYCVRSSLVYAKDYGVPQNRPRVLLVGIRNDIVEACDLVDPRLSSADAVDCGFLPAAKPGQYPDLDELLGDLVDDEVASALREQSFRSGRFETREYPDRPRTKIQKKLRSAPNWDTSHVVELTEQEYSKHKKQIVEKFDHMLRNDGEIPDHFKTKKFSQRLLKAKWNNSAPNITVASLADDYVHYCQPRALTVREWARLQFFPDWYKFCGKRTTGGLRRAGNPRIGMFDREVPKYTQIGNAVPVGLAEKVAAHFRDILDNALEQK